MTKSSSPELSEAQVVQLARNALLVAGAEMGAEGDHWPAVKATIHDLMKEWEELQIEQAVFEEMRKHLYAQLQDMEKLLAAATPDIQAQATPHIQELRDIYDAAFADIARNDLLVEESELPIYLKRAEFMMQMLEEDDDTAL